MIGLVITGHIEFANGMKSALQAIAGDLPQMEFVTFPETITPDDLERNLGEAAKRVDTGDGVLFLTDLFGGTPNNMCVKLIMQNDNYECVCGTNLSMAITAAMEREDFTKAEIIEMLQTNEVTQIRNMRKEIKACSIIDGTTDCSDDGI